MLNKIAQLQQAKELLALEYLQKQAAIDHMIKTALFGYSLKKDDDTDYLTGAAGGAILGGVPAAVGTGGIAGLGRALARRIPIEELDDATANFIKNIQNWKTRNILGAALLAGLLGAGAGSLTNVAGTAVGDLIGLG